LDDVYAIGQLNHIAIDPLLGSDRPRWQICCKKAARQITGVFRSEKQGRH